MAVAGRIRPNLKIRIATMFDTALLIVSALSVALMVAFSDLP
jgi:hypothetical protein